MSATEDDATSDDDLVPDDGEEIGDEVRVKLTGACASCPSSQATIKGWVEAQLRENIDEQLRVIEVKR